MHVPFPPFKAKVVEPIPVTTRAQREALLVEAGYNLFRIPADRVSIDLLTDSGTGAMSARQWGSAVQGDEAYACSPSFERFQGVVRKITGMDHVLPVHQGRAAERILFEAIVRKGDLVPSNTAFDTTRANIERMGATVVDLPHPSAADPVSDSPFKGDIDLERLEGVLAENRGRVPCVILTITNNAGGGQPMHPDNARAAAALCRRYGVPVWIDAARFAENAALVIERDPRLHDATPAAVARGIFDLADGALMSCKKDGISHIGGFLALRDGALSARLGEILIATEGFLTYGGLAGRDLEAIASGLEEALEPAYLAHRLCQARHLHAKLRAAGVPVLGPPGGHAVFVDAGTLASHLPAKSLPGQAVAVELFRVAGVRACEIGELMFGGGKSVRESGKELVRLALPRRVYETAHLDYVAEALGRIAKNAAALPAYEVVEGSGPLRHFVARLRPVVRSS